MGSWNFIPILQRRNVTCKGNKHPVEPPCKSHFASTCYKEQCDKRQVKGWVSWLPAQQEQQPVLSLGCQDSANIHKTGYWQRTLWGEKVADWLGCDIVLDLHWAGFCSNLAQACLCVLVRSKKGQRPAPPGPPGQRTTKIPPEYHSVPGTENAYAMAHLVKFHLLNPNWYIPRFIIYRI